MSFILRNSCTSLTHRVKAVRTSPRVLQPYNQTPKLDTFPNTHFPSNLSPFHACNETSTIPSRSSDGLNRGNDSPGTVIAYLSSSSLPTKSRIVNRSRKTSWESSAAKLSCHVTLEEIGEAALKSSRREPPFSGPVREMGVRARDDMMDWTTRYGGG